jgi:hypothetical protein
MYNTLKWVQTFAEISLPPLSTDFGPDNTM